MPESSMVKCQTALAVLTSSQTATPNKPKRYTPWSHVAGDVRATLTNAGITLCSTVDLGRQNTPEASAPGYTNRAQVATKKRVPTAANTRPRKPGAAPKTRAKVRPTKSLDNGARPSRVRACRPPSIGARVGYAL